ncbi:MAG: hypothetical protein JF565_05115 [Propionibacteriales bacterium]|nr:hypothetical protein [Propionibacteriales bacterium]
MTALHAPTRKALPMPSCVRLLVALAAVAVLGAGCTHASLPGVGGTSGGGDTGSGAVEEGTCWTGARLGADPQDILRLSAKLDVPYLVAARALADRPAFTGRVDCGADHAVEVYKVVRLPDLEPQLTDYATLLRPETPLYDQVARSVAAGCMADPLAKAVALGGVDNAVMQPQLPTGATLGWAPAAPDQWAKGQRVFACTLTWAEPDTVRYAALLTKALPTGRRTCIESRALVYVDCARRHDRERIAVIEARDAVAAGSFPGPKSIRNGPSGPYLAVPDARWAKLDAACTAYLHAISTTKKLTGIANVDAAEWPAPGDSYPIYCDADTRPDQQSLITQGSVYDRG